MVLGFKRKHKDGRPTGFAPKILSGVKKHTIREDEPDRWKEGVIIQMAYGVRTKDYEQFNAGRSDLEVCTGTQKIEIKWKNHDYTVKVDGRVLSREQVELLAINDGFDDLVEFLTWFSADFKGKIIHWTKLRY